MSFTNAVAAERTTDDVVCEHRFDIQVAFRPSCGRLIAPPPSEIRHTANRARRRCRDLDCSAQTKCCAYRSLLTCESCFRYCEHRFQKLSARFAGYGLRPFLRFCERARMTVWQAPAFEPGAFRREAKATHSMKANERHNSERQASEYTSREIFDPTGRDSTNSKF